MSGFNRQHGLANAAGIVNQYAPGAGFGREVLGGTGQFVDATDEEGVGREQVGQFRRIGGRDATVNTLIVLSGTGRSGRDTCR